jgi:hypothetical protein
MSNLDKFSLFTGIIGLVADSITLIGLAFVFTIPVPQLGFWSKPEIVAIWTFFLMVYGLIVCQFFIIQYARTRWERMGKLPNIKFRKNASLALGYLLWLPMSIIWGFAMINLFGNVYQIPINDSNASVFPQLGLLYFVLVVPFGGFALSQISIFLNNFFNPIILEKSNQE